VINTEKIAHDVFQIKKFNSKYRYIMVMMYNNYEMTTNEANL